MTIKIKQKHFLLYSQQNRKLIKLFNTLTPFITVVIFINRLFKGAKYIKESDTFETAVNSNFT